MASSLPHITQHIDHEREYHHKITVVGSRASQGDEGTEQLCVSFVCEAMYRMHIQSVGNEQTTIQATTNYI